ncbi:MAG: UDP-N-acetylmuramate--L-alanine ligase [Solirubrobacterales bacterium]
MSESQTSVEWGGRPLHFIAIGGAGMSGLALVAHRRGARVSGSDRAESSYLDRLRGAGLDPLVGHDPDSVPADAEVVVSTAIADDNPELVRARERGQPVIHRGALLAELCAERRLIAVAGTHGKTTTAGMLAHALRATGADPAFFIGGDLPGASEGGGAANAGWGKGEWAVAEADESDASFLELQPEIAVVTGVELDHHSRWRSRAELARAFARFARPAQGLALAAAPELDPIAGGQRVARYGRALLDPRVRGRVAPDRIDERVSELLPALSVPGRHNLANALGALAAVELAGLDTAGAAAALGSFPGILRRLERKGSFAGAAVYDDYAHHPTEVDAALAALRELGPRRLVAVFQPHLYSRTKALAEGFGEALAAADEVGVLDVYPAREQPVGPLAGVSGLAVARATADRAEGRPVWWLRDTETARRALAPRLGEGDLLVTLGAGDVYELADSLVGEGG